MKAKRCQLMLVSATQQNRARCEQDGEKKCACCRYYCRDGCCENSLISDFSVMINMDCSICTVTDGCNVWVLVGQSLCVYVGRLCAFTCVCVCVLAVCVCVCVCMCAGCCVCWLLCAGLNCNNYTFMTTDMTVG